MGTACFSYQSFLFNALWEVNLGIQEAPECRLLLFKSDGICSADRRAYSAVFDTIIQSSAPFLSAYSLFIMVSFLHAFCLLSASHLVNAQVATTSDLGILQLVTPTTHASEVAATAV